MSKTDLATSEIVEGHAKDRSSHPSISSWAHEVTSPLRQAEGISLLIGSDCSTNEEFVKPSPSVSQVSTDSTKCSDIV